MSKDLNFVEVIVLPGVTLTSFESPGGGEPSPFRKIKLRLMTKNPNAGLMCDMMRDEDCEVFLTVRKRTTAKVAKVDTHGGGIANDISAHL